MDDSHEIAAADANLVLLEALLDDLWTARQLLERIDRFLEGIDQADPYTARIVARLFQQQIREWKDG